MIDQRTPEWFDLRKGKFTASEIHKLMGIKGIGKTGETYILEKVAEELGATMPPVSTYAMERGTNLEPYAKEHYSQAFNASVSPAEFIIAPWCDEAGASPDGIVTDWRDTTKAKLIEIKCPLNPVVHLQNLLIKSADDLKALRPEYYYQVQMQMAVCNIPVCDFVSYYPEIDPDFRMISVTILMNDKDVDLMKTRIAQAVEIKHEYLKLIRL